MNNISDWAARWRISPRALAELQTLLTAPAFPANVGASTGSENRAQQDIRLAASQRGCRLWRNNVGAYSSKHPPSPGTRWGLANDSAAVNKQVKSSDLIGITPVIVQRSHVGRCLGVFTSIEVKKPGWKYRGTERERAQLAWISMIVASGGFAMFATCPDHLDQILIDTGVSSE